ncbi:hypothetical protein SAMN04488090_0609 [Siphonobacter aquaeclarae]|uniref:Uncharacterized protein n=1 Tax=Siphonobacter aquaeclarae TaxID=563176 RepID=A0A1G9IT65_9BACT|nr:hypothetical protein SAMN04488090_0609 [Siphonobacter aquaeclarae]
MALLTYLFTGAEKDDRARPRRKRSRYTQESTQYSAASGQPEFLPETEPFSCQIQRNWLRRYGPEYAKSQEVITQGYCVTVDGRLFHSISICIFRRQKIAGNQEITETSGAGTCLSRRRVRHSPQAFGAFPVTSEYFSGDHRSPHLRRSERQIRSSRNTWSCQLHPERSPKLPGWGSIKRTGTVGGSPAYAETVGE